MWGGTLRQPRVISAHRIGSEGMVQRMDALQDTRELVAFPTVSTSCNAAICAYLEEVPKKLGFATERVEYVDSNGVDKVNVVGKKGRGTGGMAYFRHTDVVPADSWFSSDHSPFEPTVTGDRLYGRGSCDMKSSIGAMLGAVEDVGDVDHRNPLYVTFTADEEIGYCGAEQVAQRSELFRGVVLGNANGIVGEPTLLNVVHAHKGTYGFTATSHGRAAHSSTSEGINASQAMIPFLDEMKRIHDETEADPAWQDPVFHPPGISWNIGINDHTRAVNMTAAQSVCTVYFRPAPGHDAKGLVDRAGGPPINAASNSNRLRRVSHCTWTLRATMSVKSWTRPAMDAARPCATGLMGRSDRAEESARAGSRRDRSGAHSR